MNILNTPIREFSFEDIVSFCEEEIPEGVQIDYKQDYPSRGLKKHIASLANTRGGIIIIGVKENTNSGVPETWEGVENVADKIERFHQEATNIEPVAVYDICATNENAEKAFILIRIYEGDSTPYFIQNNSNIWIRSGSISTPIELVSPEGLELLFGKKQKATLARKLYLERAEEVYTAGLERAEKKRQIEYARQRDDTTATQTITEYRLGTQGAMCTIEIQPHFPQKALVEPKTIKEKINELKFRQGRTEYPVHQNPFEAIPEGIFNFNVGLGDGFIECNQFLSQGLLFNSQDILRTGDGRKIIYLETLATRVFSFLQFSKNFYKEFGYQGVIKGAVTLENTEGTIFLQIIPSGWQTYDDNKVGLLSNYSWDIDIDTNILNSQELLKDYYINFIRDIYWSVGYENLNEALLEAFLQNKGFSF